jgi:hypothetical protein
MATFSADQIVSKTLIARRAVNLKRLPQDDAKTIYTVPAGGTVGVVYSWTGGNTSPLWWMFYDENQKTYYAKHESGAFDIDTLKDQGALDVKQQAEAEKEKADNGGSMFDFPNPFEGFGESLEKTMKTVVIVGGALLIGSMLISKD